MIFLPLGDFPAPAHVQVTTNLDARWMIAIIHTPLDDKSATSQPPAHVSDRSGDATPRLQKALLRSEQATAPFPPRARRLPAYGRSRRSSNAKASAPPTETPAHRRVSAIDISKPSLLPIVGLRLHPRTSQPPCFRRPVLTECPPVLLCRGFYANVVWFGTGSLLPFLCALLCLRQEEEDVHAACGVGVRRPWVLGDGDESPTAPPACRGIRQEEKAGARGTFGKSMEFSSAYA